MDDNKKLNLDFYLKMYQEQLTQIRHYETQRSTIVTAIIAISGAIIGLITHDNKIEDSDKYLTYSLIFIGCWGTSFLFRHSKRLKKQKDIAYKYRQVLHKLIQIPESTNAHENDEFENPELMSMRYWWIGVSIAIIIIGCVIGVQIMRSPKSISPRPSVQCSQSPVPNK